MHKHWKIEQHGDLTGKIIVVTGATSGLGLEAAKELASRGANVIATARNASRGESALQAIRAAGPAATAEIATLDLASLVSVHDCIAQIGSRYGHIDALINNAGVMATPFEQTKDGFELQIGTNHLGHFALTAGLLPLLESSTSGRVVTMSSVGHRWGRIDLGDLNWITRRYSRWPAYFQSKLANLLFAYELDRRLRAAGSSVLSLASHPGGSRSHLGVGYSGIQGAFQTAFFAGIRPLLMSTHDGMLPALRATLDTSLIGGTYVGPSGPGEYRGKPVVVGSSARSQDLSVATELWKLSNELTGTSWVFNKADRIE
jgi:NAD(P)-dependent dehydrogenase (short-subunit alcohol dehydrogenase family)